MRTALIPTKTGNADPVDCFTITDLPWHLLDLKKFKAKNKRGVRFCQAIMTFDIETSTMGNKDDGYQGFMYHWQAVLDGQPIYGRRWEEVIFLLEEIQRRFMLGPKDRLVCYVHNLGYEFQFLIDFLQSIYPDGLKIFAAQKRKPMYVLCPSGIEFRCSYKLTNMSLAAATKKEIGCTHLKAVGDLDYKILRTPDTILTDEEFGYCMGDVISLYDFIKARLANDHDNLETVPMTSTGYPRRDCRRACRSDESYRKFFTKLHIPVNVYLMLKEAARGGDTHANRIHAGKLMRDMDSFDVASSYPFQLVAYKYPMTIFMPYGDRLSMTEFRECLAQYACLFRIVLINPRLKEHIAYPYIPTSKLTAFHHPSARCDNDRLMTCDWLQMTITDIDFELIERQYEWDEIYISDMMVAEYDYLPECLLNVIRKYFTRKSELKVQLKDLEDADQEHTALYEDLEYQYGKSKNLLNGIFGMMYQDPVRSTIEFDGEWKEQKLTDEAEIEKALDKFEKSRNSFLYYPWGVWTTAHARRHLADLVALAGDPDGKGERQDLAVYSDTDSVKAIHNDIATSLIEQRNAQIRELAERRQAYADVTNASGETIRFYMGIYEKENKEPITEFKTLGAKKYAYTYKGELHVTVSGVNKKEGSAELGTISNFETGFVFQRAGGQELYYNDNVGIRTIEVDGCTFTTASNIGMVDSTYTLGITDEYSALIYWEEYH